MIFYVCCFLSACFDSKNHPPIANASINNNTPLLSDSVTLNANLSSDVDGDILTYQWEIMERPADSHVALSDSRAINPTFEIDKLGDYLIKLVVNDGEVDSNAAFLTVSTLNLAPKAEMKSSGSTHAENFIVGDKIELDGSSSFDPEHQSLLYHWNLSVKPELSEALLDNNESVKPSFIADVSGNYIFELTVDDGVNTSLSNTIQIEVIANEPPIAVVNATRTHYVVGDKIELDGSPSTDPENQSLFYHWNLSAKPELSETVLNHDESVNPNFTADESGNYIVELTVDDGVNTSLINTIQIDVIAVNEPPIAIISAARTHYIVGDNIELDGSPSTDPENQSLFYHWNLSIKPELSEAVLNHNETVEPNFIADVSGNYVVELTVDDGVNTSLVNTIQINVIAVNEPPIAVINTAGIHYVVGDKIELDGSQSSDPENQTLFYHWEIIVKPDGSQAELDNNLSVSPFFIVDVAGTYIIHLVVDDTVNKSLFATIPLNVIASNTAPFAIANDVSNLNGKSYIAGDTLRLDGNGSYDPENKKLNYQWEITEKPPNSLTQLSSTNDFTTSFIADIPGVYIVHLYVDDGDLQSKYDSVIFEIEPAERLTDTKPFAEAGPDQALYTADVKIQLDGTNSYDIENDTLTYRWEMIVKPDTSFAVLSDTSSSTPFFTADILGSYVVKLIVSDINGESHWDTVVATPHNNPELACADCHNNEITRGKASDHLSNYDDCQACHFIDGFIPVKGTFHAHGHRARPSQCDICHNGIAAKTKPIDHMVTEKDCKFCHLLTSETWIPALRVPSNPGFSHSGIFSLCGDCHDNIIQKGKPDGHMPASSRCNACHAINAWSPALHLEHTQALGSCRNCHDPGPDQDETIQPQDHLKTSSNCLACHTEDTWIPILRIDHSEVIGSCGSCHNGIIARGKAIDHIDSSTFCDKCHNSFNWRQITTGHVLFSGNCIDCHNGAISTGTPDSHVLISEFCEACHNEVNWIPDVIDHKQVLGECASCHDQTGNPFEGTPHISTTSKCDACHGTIVWAPTISLDHKEVIGKCIDCHNNAITRWKSPLHIPTTNSCEACHSTKSFNPAIEVDHNMVLGTCFNCHNDIFAKNRSSIHIITTNLCEACHSSTAFSPAITIDHNEVLMPCIDCHNEQVEAGKSASHIQTNDKCEMCHLNVFWKPVVFVDHKAVNGACVNCHDGSISKGAPVSHSDITLYPNPRDCQNCHTTSRWEVFFPAEHETQIVDCARSSCHDGITAMEQPYNHISTTNVCEACHSTLKFSPALTTNHAMVTGSCSQCHMGEKSAAHIASSNICEACHAANVWLPLKRVDHNELTGGCFECHNSVKEIGKSETHITSDNSCEDCHATNTWSSLTVTGHVKLSPQNCLSIGCHTIGVSHSPSVIENCDSCHIVESWQNWARPTTQRAQ